METVRQIDHFYAYPVFIGPHTLQLRHQLLKILLRKRTLEVNLHT